MASTKRCTKCGVRKPVDRFAPTGKTPGRLRSVCRDCYNTATTRRRDNPESRERIRLHSKEYRRRPEKRAIFIRQDSRQYDQRHGLLCTLTVPFIQKLISRPCTYCGEDQLMMTLDRIDNQKGHTEENVLPCCSRCNYLRGSMPYAAWKILVPALRRARRAGAFGSWLGRARMTHSPKKVDMDRKKGQAPS